jgi:FHA domain-containing protein
MWKLTIEDDEGATRELDLVRDGYTVGREGSCDVFLPARNVSRRHARLERDAEGCWWLIDLGSPYGVFINGRRVMGRTALTPSDVVQAGDYWLGLVDDQPESVRAGAGSAGRRSMAPWDVRAEPDRLLVFGGPDEGACVRLDAGAVSFGVGEGVTIRLPEAAPEGVLALVRPLPQGRYEIVRRNKAIGMRVHLNLAERALLYDGDLVHFELPDQTELMAMRFLAARQVRHSTQTPFAATGEGSRLARGLRVDPATLPTLETIKATLQDLPSWWRLEGESVCPRPAGYQAPPVRFTDVTSEPAPAPKTRLASTQPPPPDVTNGPAAPNALAALTESAAPNALAAPTESAAPNESAAPTEPVAPRELAAPAELAAATASAASTEPAAPTKPAAPTEPAGRNEPAAPNESAGWNEPAASNERKRRASRWAAAAAVFMLAIGAWALSRNRSSPERLTDDVAERTANTSSAAFVAPAEAPQAASTADAIAADSVAPKAAASDGASPRDIVPTEPPTPSRPSTSAARSPGPPRVSAPTRRPEPPAQGATAADRLRAMCRAEADRIARGEASPEMVQLHRTRCP